MGILRSKLAKLDMVFAESGQLVFLNLLIEHHRIV